jgi:glutamine cyclotransferase
MPTNVSRLPSTAILLLGFLVTIIALSCRAHSGSTEPATTQIRTATPAPFRTATSALPPSTTPIATASPQPTPTPAHLQPSPFSQSPLVHSPLTQPTPPSTEVESYRVVGVYPHDRGAFTQGLVYTDGWLFEGTGLRGRSSLRRVALETGEVQQLLALSDEFFGEGITVLGDRIFQLTWQSGTGFVYDKASFSLSETFYYPTEGWGLTDDGERLIMSDGSATLHFLDPSTLTEMYQIQVYDETGPVPRLNELEFIKGEILANIWQTDRVARIDPETGRVLSWIDLSDLLSAEDYEQPVDVLNGIAYDEQGQRLFVTGKLWPKLFEIEILGSE